MPGLAQRNEHLNSSNNGFWSKQRDDISYNQLQKFWSELPLQARQKLLRIDKQTLFEQARKNMYCSRCNGLLLEGFLQIVMYGKTLQQEEGGKDLRLCASKFQVDGCQNATKGCHDEIQDPSVRPWGGLTITRDGSLTLLSCYLCSKSLKGLQIVFDSARAREQERELLYPDACGGGGRGWTGQGMGSYGRGHGTRETCALHTARLSCDTLVDFWSALGEETRQSLLRMKEEDFIERLMYRFDSKRFCRDCRRNVIREYKELKELKRLRRETRCTSWFCAADTAFQYEVSDNTIQADWHQIFVDMVGTYHYFEWAVGTGEGKSDILDFENVGLTGSVRVNGLDLVDLSVCYITLRAWKLDRRCSEIRVKAHALKGQQCVHCRLIVDDGFVSITRGESIRRLFEHAEEAEEEEDDDSMDKDGSDLNGECSRPQKHAKSPELAREFLLDAATVIFKEQVEKAFREGTARQNAHSIFVCLALKLLEVRVHVACKEIITLEKQMKLLEEEEKEKREEEERKERRRIKEREKKLRRKERLKGKDKDKEKKCLESNDISDVSKDEMSHIVDDNSNDSAGRDSIDKPSDISLSEDGSPGMQDQTFSNGHGLSVSQDESFDNVDGLVMDVKDGTNTNTFVFEESKFSRQRQKVRKEAQFANTSESRVVINKSNSRCQSDDFDTILGDTNGSNRQPRTSGSKSNTRNGGLKFNEKFNAPNYRINDKHDLHSCSCHQNGGYRAKSESRVNAERVGHESKLVNKAQFVQDTSKQSYWGHKFTQADYTRESCGRSKGRCITGNNSFRDFHNLKKVWEPIESQKKHAHSSSETDATLRLSGSNVEGVEADGKLCNSSDDSTRTSGTDYYEEKNMNNDYYEEKNMNNDARKPEAERIQDEDVGIKGPCFSTEGTLEEAISCPIKSSVFSGTSDPNMANTSNSDNSSCFSEGDSNGFSSNHGSAESSSTSDSEDAVQKLEEKKTTKCVEDAFLDSHGIGMENKQPSNKREAFKDEKAFGYPLDVPMKHFMPNPPSTITQNPEIGIPAVNVDLQHQSMLPPRHNQGLHFPVIQDPSTIGYYHQNSLSWHPSAPNGFLPFPQPNQFFYAGDFGYGLNGSSPMYMHYNPMQQWSTSLYNSAPVPVYQPAAKVNVFQAEENIQPKKVKETLAKVRTEMTCPAVTSPLEGAPRRDAVPTTNSAKKQAGDNNGFSLFQFDGPLALSKECKPLPSENGNKEGFSSEVSADLVKNGGCNKKEIVMEEYNLFAASNGIKFSLF